MFIISPLVNNAKEVKFETQEKFSKYSKNNKFNKKQNSNEMSNLFLKMIDGQINLLKQFSSTYFKIGFFKPIHNIALDLIRNMDKYSMSKFANVITENILYVFLNQQMNNNFLSNKQIMFTPPSFNMLYQTPNVPFLPANEDSSKYTLVLDLDETLVHFFYSPSGGCFLLRPKALEFLKTLASMYEICIFTAAMKDYADSILDVIDKDNRIFKHRMYRNHTSIVGNGFVKDISKLGRDLSKVIIIDNLPENFKLQNNNGFEIKTWTEDMKDTQLADLQRILQDMHNLRVPDVRVIVKKIKEEIHRNKKCSEPIRWY